MDSKPILLSGIKPTGNLHIGNYFGAMRQQLELFKSNKYECYIMIADYHALTTVQNAIEMQQLILDLATAYLAIGLDPEQVVLFKQSNVSEHTELAWIFDTITTMPYLMRAHAFKDAEAKNKEISVGVFNYPMLMAADILLYDTAIVPVGQDQKQHIEYARDTAEKFNRIYTKDSEEIFAMPEPYIMPEVAVVPGTDGQKMSKSYGNVIPLFASHDEITKAVMSIVTDSTGDNPSNVYAIHRLLKSEAELESLYKEHKGKYQILKQTLIEDLEIFISPFREKYEALKKNPGFVLEVLKKGAERAGEKAALKMIGVRRAIGVTE